MRSQVSGGWRSVTDYSLHLLVGVIGSVLLATVAAFGFALIWDAVSSTSNASALQRLGTHRPFPIQLFCAYLLGGLAAPRLASPKLGRWIWIVPLANLLVRMLLWQPVSVVSENTVWEHFFGACPERFCADQFQVTLPVYVSVVYSFAALLSTRGGRRDEATAASA